MYFIIFSKTYREVLKTEVWEDIPKACCSVCVQILAAATTACFQTAVRKLGLIENRQVKQNVNQENIS